MTARAAGTRSAAPANVTECTLYNIQCWCVCASGGGEADPRSGHGGQQEHVRSVRTQRHHRESHREPHGGGRRARQV